VYLAGAGPGDPGLLTRKAEQVLRQAEVVIYDRLVSADILALANPAANFIYAGKSGGQYEEIQAEIYAWYLRLRHLPGPIVRLKGGDPMVFGRSAEELEFLRRHGFEVEVIPGVSSATAAPALAGIPLTIRGVASTFTVLAGTRHNLETLDWLVYRHIDTLVVLMGAENRALIAASLINAGRLPDEPVAFIERASLEDQRVVIATLHDVARNKIDVKPPAVFVVGEAIRLRHVSSVAAMAEAARP
jgi:uroporphyrin-III C-methyltransferase